LSKLRVHDMAGEFGISSDEVIALLRQMDVPVRSHLSLLTDDQVARLRARWEREKRARVEKQSAPATTTRRRRSTAAAPVPEPVAAAAGDAGIRRRRRAEIPTPAIEIEEPPVAAPSEAPDEIAAESTFTVDHETEAPTERGLPAEVTPPYEAAPPVVERPAPPAPATPDEEQRVSSIPSRFPEETRAPAAHAPPTRPAAPPSAPDRPRPRPITPGAPRPRPVASSGSFMPPRPIASAAPGGTATPTRRDDRQQSGGAHTERGRRKKGKRGAVDQEAVDANISKTMATLRGAPQRRTASDLRRGVREEMEAARAAELERERKTVRVNEFITVSELAQILKIAATEIVAFAFKNLGLMVTINQRLDFDQIELIASEFGFEAVREDAYQAEEAATETADRPEDLAPRPPVVTIMGHVDHGKTSLLDYVRKANVVAGEAGGITQHIGAYHVTLPNGKEISFLDTPGHEAFTAMRARGAQVTDIVVLVVAADDGIMPQTVEAISHAKNAAVPLIVAINKIDLPQANPSRVKQELLQHGVVLEEFGGQVLSAEISAKKGTNVDSLLDSILLQAEILDLKANPDRRAEGSVVEAQLDPGKGPVATVLVRNGTLKIGDDFICGLFSGRVRALLDERGKTIKTAGPAIPAQVLGIEGVPMAGDQLLVVEDATAARDVAQRRQRLDREAKSRRTSRGGVSLEDFMAQSAAGATLDE
jgi:translation initiation factor IF-2